MARTSIKSIQIPEGVTLTSDQNLITASGKLGEMSLNLHQDVDLLKEDSSISFQPNKKTKESLAITGTMRALSVNLMKGVSDGFEKKLEINGVGYRAQMQGNVLKLSLGLSHDVDFEVPQGVTVTAPKQTEIIVEGIDSQLVGQVAANIRAWRKPEPYKGKGIKYKDEYIFRKEGKKK